MQNRPASGQSRYQPQSPQRPVPPRAQSGYSPQRPPRAPQGYRGGSASPGVAPRRAPASPVRSFDTAPLTRRPSPVKPLCVLAAALVLGILLQFVLMPGGWIMAEKAKATEAVAEIASTRGVRINEIMTANKNACFDETGACPDWIELCNVSNAPVDISGWILTDKSSRTVRFSFPEYVLQPNEYVIVFASGQLKHDVGDTFHAPFKLSSLGDTLLLFDENGTIVESVNIPELNEDCVYARAADGHWTVTNEYTPMMENTSLNYAQLTTTQVLQGSDVIISEIMASNASYRSASGGLYDWIELYNRGSSAVSLSGYGLSDKATKPSRWRLPDITLQPGEYAVVYASGLDRVMDGGEMHANFSLAAEGETVYLYNASRQIVDAVTYDNLKTDQSYKLQPDGTWMTSTSPTPGSAN